MITRDSGTRELDLRDTCRRCKGKGGFAHVYIQHFEECDTCKGEGKIGLYPTDKQKEHQKLWERNSE